MASWSQVECWQKRHANQTAPAPSSISHSQRRTTPTVSRRRRLAPASHKTKKSPVLRPDFCSARTPARGAAGAPARYTRYTYARFRVKASAILPAGKRTTGSAESPQLLNIVVNIKFSQLCSTPCRDDAASADADADGRSFFSTLHTRHAESV